MNRAVLICTLCAVLSSSWLDKVDAQSTSEQDSGSILQSIGTLIQVVEGLQAEIQVQSSVLSNLVSKEELESILSDNLVTKSDMQMQKIALQNLEAKAGMHDNSLSNLQATLNELKTLLINSNLKDDEQLTALSNTEAQPTMQTFSLDSVGENLQNQSSLVSNFLTKEIQVNNLTNKEKETTVSDGVETSAEGNESSTGSKGIVEGVIASTYDGVVIISLDSREQKMISSNFANGMAFNWQSRKVYWIEYQVGIKIADLDGRNAQLLIPDQFFLCGLAVDQITGNFYYGHAALIPREVGKSKSSIRVCNSMGQKCVTIASGVDDVGFLIWDIALHPSEGLMFWSSRGPFEKNSVTQANMDGTNATVIISERASGLYSDEFFGKLYWVNDDGDAKSIRRYDLSGDIQDVHFNTTIYPNAIAVDGDTVYFAGYSPNGVYSVTSSGKVASISNTTGEVNHIVLYGRNKVFSRSNPCSNSPCPNLCVLTRVAYTCL